MTRGLGVLGILVLAFALVVSWLVASVQAQVQPIPVTQARGKVIAVFDIAVGTGVQQNSPVYDFSAYGSLDILILSLGSNCGTSSSYVAVQSSTTSTGTAYGPRGHLFTMPDSATLTAQAFNITGFMPFARLTALIYSSCAVSVYVTPVPFSTSVTANGPYADSMVASLDHTRPVLIGGVNRQEDSPNLAIVASVDVLGRFSIAGAAVASGYGETLVTTSATEVPATGMANRSTIFIQNNGPNEIRCGNNTSVTTSTGIALYANGGNVTLDCDAATCVIRCIAKTANQLTGAATNYFEIR